MKGTSFIVALAGKFAIRVVDQALAKIWLERPLFPWVRQAPVACGDEAVYAKVDPRALERFLLERFDVHGIERFFTDHYPRLRPEVNFRQAPVCVMFDAVETWRQHGCLEGTELAEHLVAARPQSAVDVRRVFTRLESL